jgi:K+-transporting ATPase KdpF subunit
MLFYGARPGKIDAREKMNLLYIIVGIVSLLLLIYLFAALIFPEKFE